MMIEWLYIINLMGWTAIVGSVIGLTLFFMCAGRKPDDTDE